MFNLSGSEIVVILLLALVVLGPEKLPDAIRRFGRTYAELKKMGTGFQQEFKSAMEEPARELRETANLLKASVTDISGQASAVVRDAAGTDQPVKPVSRGGPADLRPADDPPQPAPALADLPFAPVEATPESLGDVPFAPGEEVAAPVERPAGPAFHSAAPPRIEAPEPPAVAVTDDGAGGREAPGT